MTKNAPLDRAPPKEMAAMMLTLSVDPEKMTTDWGGVQLAQAIRRCQDCRALHTCRYWLGDVHRDPRAFRDFCPNAGLFDRLKGPAVAAD